MLYQVVYRSRTPSSRWLYYPAWEPTDNRAQAFRWASECARTDHEVLILRAWTIERLERLGRKVVKQQTTRWMPNRQSPGGQNVLFPSEARIVDANVRDDSDAYCPIWPEERAHPSGVPEELLLEEARWNLERGNGGDLCAEGSGRPWRMHFPLQMNVLSRWVHLHGLVEHGALGGEHDGEQA